MGRGCALHLALMEACQEPPPAKRCVLLEKAVLGQAALGSPPLLLEVGTGGDAANGVGLNGQAFWVVA